MGISSKWCSAKFWNKTPNRRKLLPQERWLGSLIKKSAMLDHSRLAFDALRRISIRCFLSRARHFAIDFLTGHAYKDFFDSRLRARDLKKSKVHPTFAIDQIDRHSFSQSWCLKNAPKGQVAAKHNQNSEHGGADGTKRTSL